MSLCIILDQFSFQLSKWNTHFSPTQEDGKEIAWVFRKIVEENWLLSAEWTKYVWTSQIFWQFCELSWNFSSWFWGCPWYSQISSSAHSEDPLPLEHLWVPEPSLRSVHMVRQWQQLFCRNYMKVFTWALVAMANNSYDCISLPLPQPQE